LFDIGCSIVDDWSGGGVSPNHLDLHSALLWNRKNSAYFCDIMPVVKLACVDTSHNEIVLFAVSLIFIMSPCLLILCSYIHIFVTIWRIPSAAGRHKTFSRCSSHVLVVSLFYGTALFTYLQPKSAHTPDTDKVTALMYTVVTPALNPVIYTLRNKEVKEAF
jgi:olfactory receptor